MKRQDKSIKTILVPIAFSENCEAAKTYAFDLARSLGATVELFHVVEEQPYLTYIKQGHPRQDDIAVSEARLPIEYQTPQYLVRDLLEESRVELERIAVPSKGVQWNAKVVSGHVASQILHEIETLKPDLVVMATQQRPGLAHALLGSVTEKVVRLATAPVLALPTRQAAA